MNRHELAAFEYATAVVNGTLSAPHINVDAEFLAPKYVKIQCGEFLEMWNDENPKYIVDRKLVAKIVRVLDRMVMAKGPKRRQKISDALAGFQWFIIVSLLCCVYRDDPRRRRYQTALLEICRKNGKTFIVAILFLLLFFFEPNYSRFFSVAPDGELAREIKQAIDPLIEVNAELFDGVFKKLRDSITNKVSHTVYTPLNYSTSRMDGKEPNVFIADEIGALPSNYPIEAMRSGQDLVDNPLGFCISTKYPTIDNPLEDEVAYAKRVLDKTVEDETVFALLFEPDDTENWMTDDAVLAQGNPLAVEIDRSWSRLLQRRERAIGRESLRENFVTKHCNIIYQGAGTEAYIPIEYIQQAEVDDIDFTGQDLYVGVDLAMTTDNCAVAVAFERDGKICADVKAFVPEDRIEEKTVTERVDYPMYIRHGDCIACGDRTVDYSVIEKFVEDIEDEYGGRVVSIGYDRWNALSSAQKWEADGYTTVEIRQHSSVLHPPTKLIDEYAQSGELVLRKNKLLEINFQNARCTYDTNLNRYVTKKKSTGKVDMVVALINAVYLLQQDVIFGDDFIYQMI